MGSRGTNRFSDYPGSSDFSQKTGGHEEQNQCDRAIGKIELEDVALCDYFQKYKDVPPVNYNIKLRNVLTSGRLIIENEVGESIGLVPTRYNYLLQCIEQGYHYAGHVQASRNLPLTFVVIDLAPIR